MRLGTLVVAVALLHSSVAFGGKKEAKVSPPPPARPIVMPGGEGGIGFDDLRYSHVMGKLLVPGGRSGRLNLVDPASGGVVSIPGFSVVQEFNGGHDDGVTSVADGAGLLFATDRTSQQLSIVYYPTRTIVGQVKLSAGPDYVRWLEASRELWVTEPDSEWIEIFHLEPTRPPSLKLITRAKVPGGPESLTLDVTRGRAYTHVGDGKTAAIDLHTHAILRAFENGCGEARGAALDGSRGWLFVACQSGSVTTLDVVTGRALGTIQLGGGIDLIAYSPDLRHLYVPSRDTETLAILGVAKDGTLKVLGTVPATKDSHCVAAVGKVFFADPAHGRLMMVLDTYPESPR
jgi:DNA-binding beta-propeller fold protein YncE